MSTPVGRPNSTSQNRPRIPGEVSSLNRPATRPYRTATHSQPLTGIEARRETGRRGVAGRSAVLNASIVGLAFVLSRVIGLGREILLAERFGVGDELDAYVAAFRIPDLLFLGIMSVAFGAAFIPVFGGFLARDETNKAWRLASSVVIVSTLTTVALCVVVFILATPLMRHVVAPGLPESVLPDAVTTMRILLLSPILIGLGIAAKGMLEAQDIFTPSAMAPVVYNVATILGIVVLAPSLGITGVAIGAVVGAGLHAAVQLPRLIGTGFRLRAVGNPFAVEGIGEVLRLLAPRVVGQAAFQINFIWISSLATSAGTGEASGLNIAWQMLMLPHGLIALSISTVIFPRMARQFELKRLDQVRDTFGQALTPLLFLMIPATIGLFVFRTAIVRALFERGEFDAADTRLVGQAVGFLGLGLVWYGVVEVVTRIFYAMKDTRTPVVAGLIIIAVNIVLAWFLVDDYGAAGLAIGLTVSTGIEALILMAVLRRRLGGFGEAFAGWLGKVLMATAAMAGMATMAVPEMERAIDAGDVGQIGSAVAVAYTGALVGGTYLAVAWLLRIPEAMRAETLALEMLGRLRSRPNDRG